jgi:hypothetical protein
MRLSENLFWKASSNKTLGFIVGNTIISFSLSGCRFVYLWMITFLWEVTFRWEVTLLSEDEDFSLCGRWPAVLQSSVSVLSRGPKTPPRVDQKETASWHILSCWQADMRHRDKLPVNTDGPELGRAWWDMTAMPTHSALQPNRGARVSITPRDLCLHLPTATSITNPLLHKTDILLPLRNKIPFKSNFICHMRRIH